MAELRTEEEQIEAIKRWWKENGRTTVLGVVLAVTAVVGWQSWQHFEQTKAEQSSALYQNLIAAAASQPGQPLTEENRKTAEHLASQLKADYASTVYSQYASLWLAKNAVESGDLATAKNELQWVLGQEPDASMKSAAELRLARILLEEGQLDAALAIAEASPATGFESRYQELKGDVLVAQGNTAGAHNAYEAALASVPANQQRPVLIMKRDNYAGEGQ